VRSSSGECSLQTLYLEVTENRDEETLPVEGRARVRVSFTGNGKPSVRGPESKNIWMVRRERIGEQGGTTAVEDLSPEIRTWGGMVAREGKKERLRGVKKRGRKGNGLKQGKQEGYNTTCNHKGRNSRASTALEMWARPSRTRGGRGRGTKQMIERGGAGKDGRRPFKIVTRGVVDGKMELVRRRRGVLEEKGWGGGTNTSSRAVGL